MSESLTPGLNAQVADPTVAQAFEVMGIAHDEQHWATVVEVGDAWLNARGGMNPTAATWYAQALQGVGRYEDAVMWAGVAAKHMPKDEPIPTIAAWSTYAQALSRVGMFDRAKTAMGTAISIRADHAETTEKQGHMLATMALTTRKPLNVGGRMVSADALWSKAWTMMESRLTREDKALPPGFRPWDGTTLEPVSVLHEQGMGDAILTARWLPWLVECTGHPVTYYGPPILGSWMTSCPGVVLGDFDGAQARADAGEDMGAAVRCMSLPHHQHMQKVADLPAPWAPPSLVSGRAYRPRGGPIRVGVCWRGAKIGWHDFERSYTYEQFATVFAPLTGATFVNLCHDADVPESAPFERVVFNDVMHTGQVISLLDVMVTVDTGVAHIAGSLGVPTIVIPPTVPDWRWTWPRGSSTPFYKTITVVRRQRANDEYVLKLVRRMTEGYVAALTREAA